MWKRLLVVVVLLFSGCSIHKNIEKFDDMNNRAFTKETKVNDVLKAIFTDEAYALIKNIPLRSGPNGPAFVGGVNIYSDILCVLTLHNPGRKVVIGRRYLKSMTSVSTLVHEYVHQIDDIGRDGGLDLIDRREFALALHRLHNDPKYSASADLATRCSDKWVTLTFGVGPFSEEIAYIASELVTSGGPDYMWHVFRKILRRSETEEAIAVYRNSMTDNQCKHQS